jgi:hypothetical protein
VEQESDPPSKPVEDDTELRVLIEESEGTEEQQQGRCVSSIEYGAILFGSNRYEC